MYKKPKSIDGLMRHLRNKGVKISGSTQKRKLMNMGYYHGYKGYRYIKNPANKILFNDFNELVAIYECDCRLKSLFYPYIMQIETALKNYILEVIVEFAKSDNFITIYNVVLDDYKSFRKNKDFKNELKKRLKMRNMIYNSQTEAYEKGTKIATHFLNKNMNLPIWAIFELLTLGEFGTFVSTINLDCRKKISKKIGIRPSDDTSAQIPKQIIFTLKEIRNAIAHNNVIFDVRFKNSRINNQFIQAIKHVTSIQNITLDSIIDYFILIIYILKNIHLTKTEMKKIVNNFEEISEDLQRKIPFSIYSQIFQTDNRNKIAALKKFISR